MKSYLRCFYLCFLGLLFWWKLLRWLKKNKNKNCPNNLNIYTTPIAVSQLWDISQYKEVGPTICRSWTFRCQTSFFFQFQTTFLSLAAFLGNTSRFFFEIKIYFHVQNFMVSRLAPVWNFKSHKRKTLCGNFFLARFHFWLF